jgi:peptidoglycan/LPS O-acetylase OafA/YrhL
MNATMWDGLRGQQGVAIFFVLSGYLITTLLLREQDRRGRVSLRGFYIRRAARILPLYLLILAAYVVAILVLGIDSGKKDALQSALPYYLTFTNEIHINAVAGSPTPYYQTWSLGVEEKFYAVWPLLMFALLAARPRMRTAVTGGLAVLTVTLAAASVGSWGRWYEGIVVGALAGFALHDRRIYGWAQRLPVWLGLIALVSAQVAVCLLHHPAIVVFPWLVALAVIGAVTTDAPWVRWLSWRPLVLVGVLSYGMYLVHIACIRAVEPVLAPSRGSRLVDVGAYVATVASSAAVAWVLHRTVEAPMIRVGRRVSGRPARA